jgi:hypothetical protein
MFSPVKRGIVAVMRVTEMVDARGFSFLREKPLRRRNP